MGASLVVEARLHIHLLNYHEKIVNDFVVFMPLMVKYARKRKFCVRHECIQGE